MVNRLSSLLIATAIILFAWSGAVDLSASQQVDSGLKRALTTFATARTLNAVISVAQGTEFALEPGGVGLNFAPGQLLDPVNDLVEQFSNVMLFASVAFGVEKLLISIGAHWLVSLLLSLVALGWLFFRWRQRTVPRWLSAGLLIFVMLRFATPLALVGSDLIFTHFMSGEYASSSQVVSSASDKVAALNAQTPAVPVNPSLFDKLKGLSSNLDVAAKVEQFKQIAEQTTEHIINLIVLFLMQTLLVPLGLLWGLYILVRGMVRATPDYLKHRIV